MPVTKPHLCWTRTRVNAHQLKPCGTNAYTDAQGRDVQIIVGFDINSPSELHPNGLPNKCMDNHHDPKADELVRAGSCEEARKNKTNKWQAINKSGSGTVVEPATILSLGPQDEDDEWPEVQPLGKDYCNDKKCGLCQGDCDSDSQCAPGLKCYQRDEYEHVPGESLYLFISQYLCLYFGV